MTEPWTLRQLQAAMREQGWERMVGPGSGWKHTRTGKQIELLDWNSKAKCVEWEVWAEAEKTPPPF